MKINNNLKLTEKQKDEIRKYIKIMEDQNFQLSHCNYKLAYFQLIKKHNENDIYRFAVAGIITILIFGKTLPLIVLFSSSVLTGAVLNYIYKVITRKKQIKNLYCHDQLVIKENNEKISKLKLNITDKNDVLNVELYKIADKEILEKINIVFNLIVEFPENIQYLYTYMLRNIEETYLVQNKSNHENARKVAILFLDELIRRAHDYQITLNKIQENSNIINESAILKREKKNKKNN